MDPNVPNTPDNQQTPDDDPAAGLEVEESKKAKPSDELASWVMEKVNRWRQSRDASHSSNWDKYYRIWRGQWDPSLKGKLAERSKIITPATQSAVDQTVAEMAEAVFGRGMWFDLSDTMEDSNPQLQTEMEMVRDNLIEDFSNSRLVADCIEVFYNGAIYGTGIAKRVIDTSMEGVDYVCWKPVKPDNFVWDTAALTIDDALGVAHETIRPLHEVKEKQESGEYFDDEVGSATGFGSTNLLKSSLSDIIEIDPQDGIYITEYHGKVPTRMLYPKDSDKNPDSDLTVDESDDDDDDDDKYVEAVIVIGNGTTLLKAEENGLKDRGFIAYQHHRAPNSFCGIGVVEKAFNSQAGLDGEVRARMDALALTTYPTVGVDATRMPRNLNMQVAPGKVYLTNGPPNEVIQPISFGSLNNASFQQSGDMERFVQVATGATDPAKPLQANQTASGSSMASTAFIKRAKLTMQSVDTDFLNPLIRKSILTYATLNPQRYPHLPMFSVNSTMSIMAREFEQMQMTNLLAVIPQQSPAFNIILKGIIENYSGPSKDKILQAIDQSMKPDPQQQQIQQQTQQIQLQTLQATLQKTQAEIDEIKGRAQLSGARAQTEQVKAKLAPVTTQIQASQLAVSSKTADTQARQLEIDAAKVQIDHHHRTHDRAASLEAARAAAAGRQSGAA